MAKWGVDGGGRGRACVKHLAITYKPKFISVVTSPDELV